MIISITFPSTITTIFSYETSHVKVAINSHVKVQTMNSLETQQPMFSVPSNSNSTYLTKLK